MSLLQSLWLCVQIFRNGMIDSPAEYGGPRDGPGIVAYVEKASGPPSKEIKTAAEVRPGLHNSSQLATSTVLLQSRVMVLVLPTCLAGMHTGYTAVPAFLLLIAGGGAQTEGPSSDWSVQKRRRQSLQGV